jgi:ferric-dicitrate binding protein FerR (iron transport regulator)
MVELARKQMTRATRPKGAKPDLAARSHPPVPRRTPRASSALVATMSVRAAVQPLSVGSWVSPTRGRSSSFESAVSERQSTSLRSGLTNSKFEAETHARVEAKVGLCWKAAEQVCPG